jgi:hypothetical protein
LFAEFEPPLFLDPAPARPLEDVLFDFNLVEELRVTAVGMNLGVGDALKSVACVM